MLEPRQRAFFARSPKELIARGHDTQAYEPKGAWSLANLLKDHGPKALAPFRTHYPELSSTEHDEHTDLSELVDGADLVIVHEWNEPKLVAELGRLRARGGRFLLLFHDTHHRAVSAPNEMRAYKLDAYDGVLAFGAALARVYENWGWRNRAYVWHEAADTRRFHPIPPRDGEGDHAQHGGGGGVQGSQPPPSALRAATSPRAGRQGLVWIGNWGDGERSEELVHFLLQPARAAQLLLDIYGVRYPDAAKCTLKYYGARYHGWVANAEAPRVFSTHLATVHVPRRFYTKLLPGIPTIRVFEALACGIPLVSAPWDDCEHLFRVGEDFLMVQDGAQMTRALRALRSDSELRAKLARDGLETIRARHTCKHRANELLAIVEQLHAPALRSVA